MPLPVIGARVKVHRDYSELQTKPQRSRLEPRGDGSLSRGERPLYPQRQRKSAGFLREQYSLDSQGPYMKFK